MKQLPRLALSVRQPWAWAIIHADKDIENRSRIAVRKGGMGRGEICIHASKGMTQDEYRDAAAFMASIGVACPPPADLVRGGIIGTACVRDVVKASASRWFFGPVGLLLADQRACAPVACGGALGFFEWKAGASDVLEAPKPWMTPAARSGRGRAERAVGASDDLFGGDK